MEKVKKQFTGRNNEIIDFWDIYNKNDNKYRVINYYGTQGIGKSRLLNQLEDELKTKEKKARFVKIDFNLKGSENNSSQSKESILLNLRNKLIDKYKFNFKLFDKALYQYYSSIGLSKNKKEVQMLLQKNAGISQAVDIIQDFLGGAGIIISIIKSIDIGVSFVRELLNNSKKEFDAEILYENLAKCFAIDLKNNIHKLKKPLVIFMDSYDVLIKNEKKHDSDNWLKNDIIKNLDNVIWVIAGNIPFRCSKEEEETIGIRKYLICNLNEVEGLAVLKASGVEDNELALKLYKKFDGVPMYLSWCIDRYNSLKEQNIIPTVDDFGENQEELAENIVKSLSLEDKEIVSYLACIDSWDDEFIRKVGSKFITCFSYLRYKELKTQSIIEENANGKYYILKVPRKIIYKNCDENIKEVARENLSIYYGEQLEKENLTTEETIDVLHKYIINNIYAEKNDNLAMDNYRKLAKNIEELEKLGKYNELSSIFYYLWKRFKDNITISSEIARKLIDYDIKNGKYDYAEDIANKYEKIYKDYKDEYKNEYLNSQVLKGEALLYNGKFDEALKILENAEKIEPDNLFVKEQIALTLGKKGENKRALELFKEILSNELEEDKKRITKRNIANAYSHLGEYKNAIDVYKELLNNPTSELEEASLRNNIANTLSILGDNDIAYSEMQKAYEIRKELLGEKHPYTLNTLNNMANILSRSNKYDEAIKIYDEIYLLRKEAFGITNDATISTLNAEGMTYLYKGDISKAIELLENSYGAYLKNHDKENLRVIGVMSNLAKAYLENSDYEKALEYAKYAYDKRIEKLSNKNINTLTTAKILGEIYLRSGDIEKGKVFLEDTLKVAKETKISNKNSIVKEIEELLRI